MIRIFLIIVFDLFGKNLKSGYYLKYFREQI